MKILKKINKHPIIFLLSILILLFSYFKFWPYYTTKADLYYGGFTFSSKKGEEGEPKLIFYSDKDLLNLFNQQSKIYSPWDLNFSCPFVLEHKSMYKEDEDGNVAIVAGLSDSISLYGLTHTLAKPNKKDDKFLYEIDMSLYLKNKTLNDYRSILLNKKTIKCWAEIRFYFMPSYYSNPVEVPTADILKVLDEYEEKKNTLVGVEEEEF